MAADASVPPRSTSDCGPDDMRCYAPRQAGGGDQPGVVGRSPGSDSRSAHGNTYLKR